VTDGQIIDDLGLVEPDVQQFCSCEGPDDRWIVVRTLARQEKALAKTLGKMGTRFYLPLIPTLRYYGRRRVTVATPLFAGYLFIRGSLEQCYEADRTHRIASVLHVADQVRLNDELKSLWIVLSNSHSLNVYPHLGVGDRVEIRAGPLRGVKGYIEQRPDTVRRLILNVDILGRALSLELDASLVDKI
jgi:transcription antitermination factor NusG